MARRRIVTIFVETSLRTRFVCQAPRNLTFGELREALKRDHQWCYPNMGEVGLHFVMVEVNSAQYRVTDAAVVGGLFHGDDGFLKLDMEIVDRLSLSAERGDASALDSQQLPDQVNLLEVATDARAEDALAADALGSVEGLTTSNLLRDFSAGNTNIPSPLEEAVALQDASLALQADKGKVDSEIPMDLTKVGGKGKLQNEELGVAKLKQKGPEAIQKDNDLVSLKSRDNQSSQKVELRVAGEDSILDALNGLGAAHAMGKNSRKLSACENSEERVALSDKMLSEANFVTQGSLMNVDKSLDFQKEEKKESDKKNVLTQETESNVIQQNQSPIINRLSHHMNANTQSQGNELKSKKKVSYGAHKADCKKILTDARKRIDHMPEHVEVTALPGNYGDTHLLDPSNNSNAMNAGSEGTTKKRRKTFVATELESRESPLKKAAGPEKSIYPEQILGGDVKSFKDHAISSKSKEDTFLTVCGGKQKVHVIDSFQGNDVGMMKNHQSSADAVDSSANSDLDGKDSTPNKSTDVEMENFIIPLLSFQDAKPMLSEENKLEISKSCPPEKSSRFKKKKRKGLVEETETETETKTKTKTENESGPSANGRHERSELADDLEYTVDTNVGKGEKDENLQQVDDKRNDKKVKRHQSSIFTGSEIVETSSRSERENLGKKYHSNNKNGLDQIENKSESLPQEMSVEMGDRNAGMLKRKKVKITVGLKIEKSESKQERGKMEIVHEQAFPLSEQNIEHGSKDGKSNEQNGNFRKPFSPEKILRKHERENYNHLVADEFGARNALVHETAKANVIPKDFVAFLLPSSRKQKRNKSKVVFATEEQEKPKVDGLLKTESNNHNLIDAAVENNIDGAPKDQIETKTKSSSGKTRLRKKKDLDKISEDAVNRVFQDDMLFIGNMASPTERIALDVKHTKDDGLSKSSKCTGEKPIPLKPPRITPNQSEMPIVPKPARIRPKVESPCPAGCGKVYSGKTSSWYQHRKTCKGL